MQTCASKRVARPSSLLLILALLAAPVLAQPLADRVPADALIYVGWRGANDMGPGYAGSHLKAVLEASDLPKLINEAMPRMFKKFGAAEPDAAEAMALVSAVGGPMWRHPTAFYFGGLDVNNPNGPAPKLALICQAGNEAQAMADQLKKLVAQAGQTPFPINVTQQGDTVILSTGPNQWAAGNPAAALPARKEFAAALGQVSKESVAAAYVDVEGLVALADMLIGQNPEAAKTWSSIRDGLGLKGIKRGIFTAGFDGKDWVTQAFVEAPAPRTGALPAMLDSKPLSDDALKLIPQSATVAAAGKFDLGGLVRAIRDGAAKMDPNAGKAVDDAFAQAREMVGFDVQTDFLDQFGDEWVIYVDPLAGGSGLLGFSIVNRPKDANKLTSSLNKLENMANAMIKGAMGPPQPGQPQPSFQIKQSKVNDNLTLHSFSVPFVAPTWATADGNLYLGLYPQVVVGAAEHVSSKGKTLLDNEDFLAVRKRLGNQTGVTGVNFINLPKTAPDGYQGVMVISQLYLGAADLFGADTPPLVLPPLRKLMPHLSPAGGVTWVDNAGWHAKSISPFPLSESLQPGGAGQVLVAQYAAMVPILLPSLNRAREQANRVKCASNLRQIGMGCLLYANENRGNYPPDFGTILKTQDVSIEVFLCPSHGGDLPADVRGRLPEQNAPWLNDNAHYVYLGKGLKNTAGAEVVVAYEKPGNHRQQGVNMLYADGHVEWQSMPTAAQQIERQTGKKPW